MIYVALLRGINVGGNALIRMAALKVCFEELGLKDVQTYIQSGNVVFKSNVKNQRKLEVTIERALLKTFKLPVKVVVRSYPEMKATVKAIPKRWLTDKHWKYNIIFLRYTVDSKTILNELHPKAQIEELFYKPGVLFWAALTSDLTKSNMIKLAKEKLYKQVTVRNLNTTLKLFALMEGSSKQSR